MKYLLPLSLGIIGTFLVVLFGWLLISSAAYEEPICNPYLRYYDECRNQICRGGYGGTGSTLSIFYYNPLTDDYEIPSEYHVGGRYSLNGFIINDNYCKKPISAEEKYGQYKLDPQNFTNSPDYLDLKFTYLVQINKMSDTERPSVVYLNSFGGVIKASEEKTHSFQWVPKETGQYLIERFIWYDIDKPIALTPKHAIYVEVYENPNNNKTTDLPQKPKENNSLTLKSSYLDVKQGSVELSHSGDEMSQTIDYYITTEPKAKGKVTVDIFKNGQFMRTDTLSDHNTVKQASGDEYYYYKLTISGKKDQDTYKIEFKHDGQSVEKTLPITSTSMGIVNTEIQSPLQQFRSGTPVNQIKCKEGLVLLLHPIIETPACVKAKTEQKLVQRGWYYPVPLGWPTGSQNVFLEGFKDSYETNESISFIVIKSGQKCGSSEISIIDALTSEFVAGVGIDYQCIAKYLSEDSRIDIPYQGQDTLFKIDKVGSYTIIVKLEGEPVFEKGFVVKENTK